jgi:hypothetical protein
LFSELLRRDPQLEACLVNDASHITKGASGTHVEKIQSALLIIDDAQIDKSELKSKTYGTTTAAAILAFKKARNIINFSYETQADNIVGKMTIAALDKEMLRFELAGNMPNACSGKRSPPGAL